MRTASGGPLLLIAMIAAACNTSTSPGKLVASELILVDAAGKPRAELRVDATGTVALGLLDTNQRRRVELSAKTSGSGLILVDEGGRKRAEINATNDAGVLLFDPAGRTRAGIQVDSLGQPAVAIYSEAGKAVGALMTYSTGTGLVLYDESGVARAKLTSEPMGQQLVLLDKGGNQRAELSASPNGEGLRFYDDQGVHLAELSVSDGNGIVFYDSKGTPRLMLGMKGDSHLFAVLDSQGNPVALR
jgi:hypothetical protein